MICNAPGERCACSFIACHSSLINLAHKINLILFRAHTHNLRERGTFSLFDYHILVMLSSLQVFGKLVALGRQMRALLDEHHLSRRRRRGLGLGAHELAIGFRLLRLRNGLGSFCPQR